MKALSHIEKYDEPIKGFSTFFCELTPEDIDMNMNTEGKYTPVRIGKLLDPTEFPSLKLYGHKRNYLIYCELEKLSVNMDNCEANLSHYSVELLNNKDFK